ncbi:MAG TPA: DUF433 domain-containing protein [Pirellulales bacterium]|nr:DUF433 domain-containing protein [Pirellulales bacterium]
MSTKTEITIVDRGRGPQLSTSRITVQDLVPYFQDGCSHAEIMRWIPCLTDEEIRVIKQYIDEHWDEVMAEDRRIEQRNATRKNSPEVERILREARAERLATTERLQREQADRDTK